MTNKKKEKNIEMLERDKQETSEDALFKSER